MLRKLFIRLIREELQSAYEMGMVKGYELGKMMGESERTNRGFIIGSEVDKQIEEILKRMG